MSYNRHLAELITNEGHCSSECNAKGVADIAGKIRLPGYGNRYMVNHGVNDVASPMVNEVEIQGG
jgi:hypothetical protein